MPYSIFDIEITKPLPKITLPIDVDGYAILLRRNDKPIDFWMEKYLSNRIVNPNELGQRIAEKTKDKILAENIREELRNSATYSELPSVTVAVCTKDRPSLLAQCLDSLKINGAWPHEKSKILEILVIDNAPSDDRTKFMAESMAGVKYICEPKPGLNFARNTAVRKANGQLIAFLDDDVTVDRHWLDGLQEAWTDNPDAAVFTGLVLPYELATEAQIIFEWGGGFRRGFNKIRYHGQLQEGNPLYPCGAGIFGAGANMTCRKDVLVKLNGFDDALDTGAPLPGGGDLDVFYRIIRAGYPIVYEPRYLVFHKHRRQIKELWRQYRSWGLGFMAFTMKSCRTDPSQRKKFQKLILWWFRYQLGLLHRSLQKDSSVPANMRIAEITGGIIGLFGEYQRSLKRVGHIKKTIG